jgi:CRISPR-associated protein Cas2
MLNKDKRFMRLIVFFDLPTKTKHDKKVYTVFRRYLLKDGFIMLQFSVYSRVCKGLDSVESHLKYLRSILPTKGNIRMLQVTEYSPLPLSGLIYYKATQSFIYKDCVAL